MSSAASTRKQRTHNVIVCPGIEGHRLSYVRLLVTRAVELGDSIEVVAPLGTRNAPEYVLHLGAYLEDIRLTESEDFGAATLQDLIDERPGATFVFPEGDDIVTMLALRKLRPNGTRMSVLMMRPRGQASLRVRRFLESATKSLTRRLAKTSRGVRIFTLVPSTAPSVASTEVRDPIEFAPGTSAPAWRDQGAPSIWFGIVGAISRRKNIDLVARALAALEPNLGLVIAGAAEVGEEEITEWTAPMRAVGHSVVRIPRQLSDEELDSIIATIDVAVVAHSNDGPSGIMGKADVAGKHVLAAGAPTLRRELRANPELGVWTELTVPAIADGARNVLQMSARQPGDAGGSREAFARRLRQEDERG